MQGFGRVEFLNSCLEIPIVMRGSLKKKGSAGLGGEEDGSGMRSSRNSIPSSSWSGLGSSFPSLSRPGERQVRDKRDWTSSEDPGKKSRDPTTPLQGSETHGKVGKSPSGIFSSLGAAIPHPGAPAGMDPDSPHPGRAEISREAFPQSHPVAGKGEKGL